MLFIAGGTGFVGTHLIERLKKEGLSIRCLVRDEKKALELSKKGIGFHIGDITDRESLKGALKGTTLVVHLVGIMEGSPEDFNRIHVKGTENLLDEALREGIKTFFYQSALGANLNGETPYERTKAMAEDLVISSGIPYIIFRPSILIGGDVTVGQLDGFTKRLLELIKTFPFVPVPGKGDSRFQPLYIEDWCTAFIEALLKREERNRLYELGGPEHLTYNEILKTLMEFVKVNKPLVHIPLWVIKAGLPAGRLLKKATGIDIPLPTSDQLRLLSKDNITDPDCIKKYFGFTPMRFKDALFLSHQLLLRG